MSHQQIAKTFTLKKHVRTICAAAALTSIPLGNVGATGMQKQMDRVFGEMTNLTPPGVHETQRRGVLTGGRLTQKGKIVEEQIVGFVPPSWKAGCGGVDLFGGSFSFINAEQVVQLLRAVAANAKGYAFQLALDNVYPDAAKWIETFQKKIQALNQYLGNSCQLAQGLVNDATSSFNLKGKTDASLGATIAGIGKDIFGMTQEADGKSATAEYSQKKPVEFKGKHTGNIVWKQLVKNNTKSWFSGGDNNLNRAIMTVTGTVVIGMPESSNPDSTPITHIPGITKLADIIEGGSISIYKCDDGEGENDCQKLSDPKETIVGLKSKVLNLLLGNGASVGIMSKFANNQGVLTNEEKNFMANMPAGMGSIVRNLAILSPDSASIFAVEAAGAIALSMSMTMAEQYFKTVTVALTAEQSAQKKEALETLNSSMNALRSEYMTLEAKYGKLTDKLQSYNVILANSRKQRYLLGQMKSPSSSN